MYWSATKSLIMYGPFDVRTEVSEGISVKLKPVFQYAASWPMTSRSSFWIASMTKPLVSVLASASLWIYLTHWQVYPHLEVDHPLLATLASLLVGVLVHRLVSHLSTRTRHQFKGESALVRR